MSSAISVIALDIDGTLLTSQHRISPTTKTFLRQLPTEQYQIVLVTGRHHQMATPIYRELGLQTPLICSNGAYIYDFAEQQIISGQMLNEIQWLGLVPLMRQFQMEVICHCTDGIAFISGNNRVRRLLKRFAHLFADQVPTFFEHKSLSALYSKRSPVWKLEIQHEDPYQISKFINALPDALDIQAYRTDPYSVEISPKPTSKFHALEKWLQMHQQTPENVVAFGDNLNDLEMLSGVGIGIAMGNAAQETKAAARYTTLSNNEDGIVYGLKQWVLQEHPVTV